MTVARIVIASVVLVGASFAAAEARAADMGHGAHAGHAGRAQLHRSLASLHAWRLPASSRPAPARRPAHPRVPISGRHAHGPELKHRDGGARATATAGVPTAATGPLALAMLGARVSQRHRDRIRRALDLLQSRGPPRAGPSSAARCARGAQPHPSCACAPPHLHEWEPGSSLPSSLPRHWPWPAPPLAPAPALPGASSRPARPPPTRMPSFPETIFGGRKPPRTPERGRVVREYGSLDTEEQS